jgi:hypothetical protein
MKGIVVAIVVVIGVYVGIGLTLDDLPGGQKLVTVTTNSSDSSKCAIAPKVDDSKDIKVKGVPDDAPKEVKLLMKRMDKISARSSKLEKKICGSSK